jgi:hypothetical protein
VTTSLDNPGLTAALAQATEVQSWPDSTMFGDTQVAAIATDATTIAWCSPKAVWAVPKVD